MRLGHEGIDSACGRCKAEGHPTEACEEAVDWVTKGDGTREYVCATHAQDLARFGTPLADMAETPRAEACNGCGKLTRHEELEARSKLCRTCEVRDERHVHVREAEDMSVEEAMDLVDSLIGDEAEVTPEQAAEAVETMTGVAMVPADEGDAKGHERGAE